MTSRGGPRGRQTQMKNNACRTPGAIRLGSAGQCLTRKFTRAHERNSTQPSPILFSRPGSRFTTQVPNQPFPGKSAQVQIGADRPLEDLISKNIVVLLRAPFAPAREIRSK
eukprot:5955381-Pyramimonas_sp.AAC.1